MYDLINLLVESPVLQGLYFGFKFIGRLYPFWLPFFLLVTFWKVWMTYVQSKYIASQEYILLEFKLPREIVKTPQAMEMAFTNIIIGSGESTFIDRAWKGKVRAWFSFEIVSIGGKVHFFCWTRKALRNFLESHIYANYPNVEIHEVPDYARDLYFNPSENSLWGCDMVLTKPDPYPIKTYVDYGLDREMAEEEQKVDPIAPMIEFFGSVKKGEVMAMQIITRAHKARRFPEGLGEKEDGWKDAAKKEIAKIKKAATPKSAPGEGPERPQLSKGDEDKIAAIEKSISKPGFDAGIRLMYYASNESFNGINISTMLSSMKQYNSNNLNGFAPSRWLSAFDYPWEDFGEIRQNASRRKFLKAWKRRAYFHAPFKFKPSILNTEELATIFHFPGGVVETPTFSRIQSKKGGAPSNIPI